MMVGGQTVELVLPARLSVRHDILAAYTRDAGREQTARRVVAAALLLCWPEAQRRKGVPRYRGDILDYGGEAIDFLLGVRGTWPEIIAAGNAAVELVNADVVSQELVDAHKGNSEAPKGGTPGSSPGSSNGGTVTPTG